jgi:hypothetical protein
VRIDILVSVIPKGINELEKAMEEQNLKNVIGKAVFDSGYQKFVIAGSDLLSDNTKAKVVLD